MDITTRLALQSQATRLTARIPSWGKYGKHGNVTLCVSLSQRRIIPVFPELIQCKVTMRPPEAAALHIELVPLHSPLLGESWLVSFPPLSNMFKFGGSSSLSSVQAKKLRKKAVKSESNSKVQLWRTEVKITLAHRTVKDRTTRQPC